MSHGPCDDTIVAVSTAVGEGGISIVRLSGALALTIADRIFVPKRGRAPSRWASHSVRYGKIVVSGRKARRLGSSPAQVIDEVLLTVMRAPRTYTREDIVEINCHGGIQATKRVLELAMERGARMAEPGEFTKRAFMNGRIDLVQAEAVLDIIRAKTEGSLKAAVHSLEGVLSQRVNAIREDVLEIMTQVEASIDFPEEEIDCTDARSLAKSALAVVKNLRSLIGTFDEGMLLREGVSLIICGKPNVGKSSIMNLLLRRDRVIVSPIPGTTRDAVEEMVNIRGLPMRIVDTAGIGHAEDTLAEEGMSRSRRQIDRADLVLLVLDAAIGISGEDRSLARLVDGKKKVIAVNKCDLRKRIDRRRIRALCGDVPIVEISAKERTNIDALETAICAAVWSGAYTQGEAAIVTNARHKELLDKACTSMLSVRDGLAAEASPELVSVELRDAAYQLGLIVGASASDDLLDRIFERFCVGK